MRGGVVVDGGAGAARAALGDDVAGTGFALAALGGDTQFKLDLIKTHAGVRVASNFSIRNPVADANDHDFKQLWLAGYKMIEL